MKKIFGLAACIGILVIACSKNSDKTSDTGTVDCSTITTTFSANVGPLVTTSCAKSGCHASGSTNGPGALTTYTQIFNNRVAIRAAVASGEMPQDATFTATQKAIITCWIDAGAQNN
jgi:hypothetical protein